MFRRINHAPQIDASVSEQVNSILSKEIRLEVENLLSNSSLWDLSLRRTGSAVAQGELGPLNYEFFAKFLEVRAKFMPLELCYLGRPSWLPKGISSDLRIVGHTVEQEFLFCRHGSDEVFEMALDDANCPPELKLKSVYHAIVFFCRRYGHES
jgi:hypothetical protein